ncbi:MAG: hypothetical protein SGARI_005813 [Bacillariaceae sp.]
MTEEGYGKALADYVVNSSEFSCDGEGSKKFKHCYSSLATRSSVACSIKTLEKEAKRCKKTLPNPHPNSACFVCFAEERMDLCKALVTGPTETPYSLGLFEFDILFPSSYNRIPPLVTFLTTGGGQTRMGPNLYQDGKVCLSLLGTFNAGSDSERWNPDHSSLAQVLLSIQTQLLVAEPYYNEPGTEQMQVTRAGMEASTRYNANLRLATLRYAINQPLKHPPLGFEDISLRHFSMSRKRLLVQVKRWVLEAKGTALHSRLERGYCELVHLLTSVKDINSYDALPPLEDDVAALQRLQPTFLAQEHDERKPAAKEDASTAGEGINAATDEGTYNPWINGSTEIAGQHQAVEATSVEDEEMYT